MDMAQSATIEQNAVSMEFIINNNYSIPSDNSAHQIDVTNISVPAGTASLNAFAMPSNIPGGQLFKLPF
jgi:hypothetical protein